MQKGDLEDAGNSGQGKLPLTELPLLGSTKDLLNGGLWMRNLHRKKMKHMATGEVGEEMQMA